MIRLLIKNKNMLKTIRTSLPRFYAVVLSLSFFAAIAAPGFVYASQYTQQIQALQNQNAQVNQNISSLQVQASSYEQEIDSLQNQIAAIQSAINQTQDQIISIQAQIAANQILLAQEKNTLANIIQSMYVDGHMTTLESLATSNNISDFVTKIEYQNLVQQQIQGDLTKINQTQNSLNQQNTALNINLLSQKTDNNQLSSDESQQSSLLALDQQQQTSYTQQLQTNNQQMAQLEVEQALANEKAQAGSSQIESGVCQVEGDSYPASAVNGQGSNWGCDYSLDYNIDNWGMDNRECVSYAAWMVSSLYGDMPYWGGSGDAYQWIGDAESDGFPVTSTVQASDAGDIAIWGKSGVSPLGHAAYVMAVNTNGTIEVSQYNADGNGDFSIDNSVPTAGEGIQFIDFAAGD